MRIINIVISTLLLSGSAYADKTTVWIGMTTPKNGEREGIYRTTLDLDKGTLERPALVAEIADPGFLALHPNGKVLYTVCRLEKGVGGVAAFDVSDDTRTLRLLNKQTTGGGDACHVAVDRAGRCLFTAQYGGASLTAFPLSPDGRVQPHSALVRHTGSGPNQTRQEGPHPHWVGTDPKSRFLFVPDLGTDQVVIYTLDPEKCGLKPHGAGRCPAGSGPRHMVFHPNGRFAYVVNELTITVTAFRYDPAAGTLAEIQTVDSYPENVRKLPSTAAEIYIHPTGRFLYASIRNDDSIAVFQVDPDSGQLTFVEREPIRGSHPRCFNLDPSGKWLLAAGRDSNTISVFRIDQQSGRLVYNNQIVKSPAPICIEMQPVR